MMDCFKKLKQQTTLNFKKEEKIGQLKGKVVGLEKEVTATNAKNQSLTHDLSDRITELKKSRLEFATAIENKQIELSKVQGEQASSSEKVKNLLAKLDAFGDLQSNIDQIEKSSENVCKKLENKFQNSQISLQKKQERIGRLEEENRALVRAKGERDTKALVLQQKLDSLREKLKSVESQLQGAKKEKIRLGS